MDNVDRTSENRGFVTKEQLLMRLLACRDDAEILHEPDHLLYLIEMSILAVASGRETTLQKKCHDTGNDTIDDQPVNA